MGFFGKRNDMMKDKMAEEDPTQWMAHSEMAHFLLMHTKEIKYMCLFGYAFMAGNKVFGSVSPNASVAFKFVSLILGCTGGGIIVPICINTIPVPMAQDSYMIAITCSFLLHHFFPILREVLKITPIIKVCGIVLFEIQRAFVVCTLTSAGAAKIAPSQFSFPVFGPIMCGAMGGCGAAFMPLSKGLEPMKGGLAPPMLSALVGAAGYHIFLSTGLSDGCIDAQLKARVHVAALFIVVGLISGFGFGAPVKSPVPEGKKTN